MVDHFQRKLAKQYLTDWGMKYHWYCLFVRNGQSQRSASGFVRLCQKIDWVGTIKMIVVSL